MKIHDILKTAREGAGMTQTALAEAAGCHRQHVWQCEQGKRVPSLPLLLRLLRELGWELGATRPAAPAVTITIDEAP